ncbi:PREDICTED: probable cyclic nucleotide-gated ion channel 12 isoform X2 [Brassica oleracea var. oleracea]|uniref:probable cyclic nucleotide-gated ion channel 12 isoform X2 n=1 Tax=Brassica oleracea var. oleracea TaxID=109376 RepID=UPI0006A6E80D|nr:PREDICTED: probable cyclic nucleotide-gated ion channel 12 isoform X2 [Brassica oleracea var. oleracea]
MERASTMQSVHENIKSVRGQLKKVYKTLNTLENWRKAILLVCVVALGVDPLFLFIPVIDSPNFCFTFDKKLAAVVSAIRTFIDTFYVIHIIFNFITEFIAPRSQVSLRGELIVHSKATRKRLFFFHFIVDICSVIPIPQVVVLILIHRSDSLVSQAILKWIILTQYVPRIIRIYPLLKEVTRASGTIAETKWVGAAFNLFLYMLHSHVFGAFWYVSSVEKKNKCWRLECAKIFGCNLRYQYCARGRQNNGRYLNTTCPLIDPDQIIGSTVFNFGMYTDALRSGIVESKPRDFPRKFFYCFWWGLRNISALGQNLKTSNSVGDIVFALIICVSGLLLFAVLIGNIQKYLQSTTIRLDEMEEKKRDTEKWMSNRMLPEYLKERIRRYENYKWRKTRGIEEEALLHSLPKDLRLETKRHLYLTLLNSVPWLNMMDDSWLLEALCDRVKSVFYSANSYIVKEGDPVAEMLIITKGSLKSMIGFSDITGYYDSSYLQADVEGFILLHDDLKFVASHFNRSHSSRLRHMFRFYSAHWRLWAACFIQAAWREHCKRKLSRILHAKRDYNHIPQGPQLNLGAALYVSRFVSKALRNRQKNAANCSISPHMLPPIPHKPADPEFSKN